MSHHGMHIPPNMLPLLPGMNQLGKMDKAKKKSRLKKTSTTSGMDELDEAQEDEEFDVRRPAARSYQQPLGDRPGGKPREQQLSDKVIQSLLAVQEGKTE